MESGINWKNPGILKDIVTEMGGNDLNQEVQHGTQKRTIFLCVIMIIMGIILFLNAASGISSLWSRGKSGEETSSQMEEAVEAGKEMNLTESSEKIRYIQSHTDLYPSELISLLSRNVETVDFVYDYPSLVKAGQNTGKAIKNITLTKEELSGKHPLFLQWDNRWGAVPYGSSMMALSGCGPTCLSMAVVALTGDESANPAAVAQYAMKQGYYMEGTGTAWSLITEGSRHYGLTATEIGLTEQEMAAQIRRGNMLICSVSKGDFTTSGHFIVIYGYEDGWFEVNDPNSVTNSNAKWKFDRLKSQIRNIWALNPES